MILPTSNKCEVGGRELVIETGRFAEQAGGAVTVTYGGTVVLVTACTSAEPREGIDFLPLTVDYEERLYAAGKIPGGFIRREGRPTQEATLASRLTDRPIRPLLPKAWRKDIQIVVTVLSADQENDPNTLAVIGASAALSLSAVPFAGPVAATRVGFIDGELVLNPTLLQLDSSQLDLIVVSTGQAVVMVEAGAKEVAEEVILKAMESGHQANQDIIRIQSELQREHGKPKAEAPEVKVDEAIASALSQVVGDRMANACSQPQKSQRDQALDGLKEELITSLGERFSEAEIAAAFESQVKSTIRGIMLQNRTHIDGRSPNDIRPISCDVGLLPRTHGSGLFTRGLTQVLTITTLGSVGDKQPLDGLGLEEAKRFMHHYNFPPFSNGEVKRIGTPSRREIGHGALVERSVLPILPSGDDFPYTIRLVSEVLSSSGSTSMASVCASSLSLMDAGVPLKSAVAGVAMGLVTGENNDYVVLTDIEGIEDAYGDMDFKVVGTATGITGLQLDMKLKGIGTEILGQALHQARQARIFILDKMHQAINASRPELSRYAPRMYKIHIDPSKIGAVIGTGGKTIRSIIEETKASIDIEDDGTVLIGSPNEDSARKAIEIVESLTKEAEVGAIYTGKVTRLLNFGAMVEFLHGKEGLVHISELADYRVPRVEDEVSIGDEVTVKVVGIDELGRVNLSRRAVFASNADGTEANKPLNPDYPFRSARESRPGGRDRGSFRNRRPQR